MDTLNWKVDTFDNLDNKSLYEILRLRTETFVMEQNIPYQDMDNKDQRAVHLSGFIGDELVAYCRIFRAGDNYEEASMGRVIVSLPYRSLGYGHLLVDKAIELIEGQLNETKITISAQQHLELFYRQHGFVTISGMYIEEGIPHIKMKRISK